MRDHIYNGPSIIRFCKWKTVINVYIFPCIESNYQGVALKVGLFWVGVNTAIYLFIYFQWTIFV